MPLPAGDDVEESRTLSVGVKRNFPASEGRSSGHSTPNKRSRRDRANLQDGRSSATVKDASFSSRDRMMHSQSEDSSDAEAHTRARPAATNWNQGAQGTIRTSLRGGDQALGANRLAAGFPRQPPAQLSGRSGSALTTSLARSSTGESQDDAIEISSDSEVESSSEGGMVINVEGQDKTTTSIPVAESDEEMEEGEMRSSPRHTASEISSPSSPPILDDAHQQLQGDLERSAIPDADSNGGSTARSSTRRLADLNPEELQKQIKYTLFHLNRDQIDLNRFVICTACLQEGHMDDCCPEKICQHCGARGEHLNRMCPQHRRCTKCRERGHDVRDCASKLKDTTVPCDYCGSNFHVEDTCTMRFFPNPPATSNFQFKLWVSCCNCASRTHLIGDCPSFNYRDQAVRWSLKSLDSHQITNMSLESGTHRQARDAMNRGMRPEGLKIKGRAEFHRTAETHTIFRDDDDPFLRPPVVLQPKTALGSGQAHSGRGTRIKIEPVRKSDNRSGPPTPGRANAPHGRGRSESWYATDSFGGRRRSRSPENDYRQDGYGPSTSYRGPVGGDHWQPREPSGIPPRPPARYDDGPRQYQAPLRHPDSPLSMQTDSWRPPLPREPLPNRPPGGTIQLPTRQGTNQWLDDQTHQPAVTATNFRPMQQQHQLGGPRGPNNGGGKGKSKNKNKGINGAGGQPSTKKRRGRQLKAG